jgi:hypothetical protein
MSFSQIVDLVKQLSYEEKIKLGDVINKELKSNNNIDSVFTHFASETSLGKDWLLPEEDEAWKNL